MTIYSDTSGRVKSTHSILGYFREYYFIHNLKMFTMDTRSADIKDQTKMNSIRFQLEKRVKFDTHKVIESTKIDETFTLILWRRQFTVSM